MALVNMKMSDSEAKAYVTGGPASPGDAPMYPYGLCICLNDESMKKLGLENPPAVGTKLQLTALVEVVSVGSRKERDGDKHSNADLQITDMELSSAPAGERQLEYTSTK